MFAGRCSYPTISTPQAFFLHMDQTLASIVRSVPTCYVGPFLGIADLVIGCPRLRRESSL